MLLTGPNENYNVRFGRKVEEDRNLKDFFEYVLNWPSAPMPYWMQNIIVQECIDVGIKQPERMITKYIDNYENVGWTDGVGGYTIHGEGEICIAYQVGRHFGTPTERNTVLHELAHWITKHFDYETGGHTPQFYSQYTRLVLKYEGNLDLLFEESNSESGGTNLFPGIELFDLTYNQGGD